MAELVNCPCGEPPNVAIFGDAIVVDHCDVSVAEVTEEEVVRRWNGLMRPRPVTQWDSAGFRLMIGDVPIGEVIESSATPGARPRYLARWFIGSTSAPVTTDPAQCRAWLADCARDSGFEVREEKEPPTAEEHP